MQRYKLSSAAIRDISDILKHSRLQFGIHARLRYQDLITQALLDISSSPERVGSVRRDEIGEGLRSYHVAYSRKRSAVANGLVQKPRHVVLYRVIDDQVIDVVRVLHDAMELQLHLLGK